MMNLRQPFCQSCGMPMGEGDTFYGTEADGSKSTDYCMYCYDNGSFTFNGTMTEMVDICVPHMTANNSAMSADEARQMLGQFLPRLKRWSGTTT